MKKRIFRVAVIYIAMMTLFFVFGCDNDSGPTGSSKVPKLEVDRSEMILAGSPRYDRINLSNSGSGILEWNVTEAPDWISLSDLVGNTVDDTVTIRITTQFSKLNFGEYSGVIKISSNGGEHTINISLSYKAPTLQIEKPIMNLDRHYSYDELEIVNAGGGELVWAIEELPDWMSFEEIEGKVYNQPEYVPYRANIWDSDLAYGDYEGSVQVNSNGGEYMIKVYLSYHREEEVFPGIGAASIEIGDTYSMVKKRWGNPDKNWYVRPEKTVFIHYFQYDRLGLLFSVETNSMILYGSGQVGYIEVRDRYDGLTIDSRIGNGSTLQEVKDAYGEPNRTENNIYYYDMGIGFKIERNNVVAMIIFEPN